MFPCMSDCLYFFVKVLAVVVKQNGKLTCIFANDTIQKMLGFSLADLIGRRLTWFFATNRQIHQPVGIKSIHQDRSVTLETSFRTNSNVNLPVLFSIKPITSSNLNTKQEYFVLVIDLRAMRAAHEQSKNLLHAERISVLGHLSTKIAHEINNPLSFLILDLDRQQELYEKILDVDLNTTNNSSSTQISEVKKKFNDHVQPILAELKEISNAANDGLKRIADTIKVVKSFGRLDDKDHKENFKLADSIDIAIRLIKSTIKNRIEIIKEFEDIQTLKGNSSRMVQVALNLMLNAVQAIEEKGTIIIRIFVTKNTMGFEIEDTGTGISPENLKKIFNPYFTSKIDGTGLGLSISQNIINDFGGSITVKSKVGTGTTFRVDFPIQPKDQYSKDENTQLVETNEFNLL